MRRVEDAPLDVVVDREALALAGQELLAVELARQNALVEFHHVVDERHLEVQARLVVAADDFLDLHAQRQFLFPDDERRGGDQDDHGQHQHQDSEYARAHQRSTRARASDEVLLSDSTPTGGRTVTVLASSTRLRSVSLSSGRDQMLPFALASIRTLR